MPIVVTPLPDPTLDEEQILIDEIRLMLRDYPQLNIVLDAVEFRREDIVHAIKRAVGHFNLITPVSRVQWRSLPEHLIFLGALRYLLLSGAILKYRNQIAVPTDGLGVINIDENAAAYAQLAAQIGAEFDQAARDVKKEINYYSHYGRLSSGYATTSRFTYR